MGCRTFGIMYGCELPNGEHDDDGESEAAWSFKARSADIEWDSDLIGLWVAVGGSGKSGVADLYDMVSVKFTPEAVRSAFPGAVAACEAAWPDFVSHMKSAGLTLTDAPEFWLVSTETA